MNEKGSILSWVVILGVLIVTGLAAVLLPALASALGAPVGVGIEAELRTVTLPMEIFGISELNSLAIMGILLVISAALIGGGGVIIAFINLLVARQVDSLKESESYKEQVSVLEQQEKERLKEIRAGREAYDDPDHQKLRWSVVSTSLTILALVFATTTIINRSLLPEEATLSLASLEIGLGIVIHAALLLVTALLLAWRMRESLFAKMEELDNGPIPWDSIWILLTGLIVVGIGAGLLVYFNIPG